MKRKFKIIILGVAVILIVPPLFLVSDHLLSRKRITAENKKALAFMAVHKATIYMLVSNILCKLDGQSDTWQKYVLDVNASFDADAAIYGDTIYLADYAEDAIKTLRLDNKESPVTLLKELYSPSCFAISSNGNKVAYHYYLDENYRSSAIGVIDIKSRIKEHTLDCGGRPNSISWGYSDNQYLFLSIGEKITRISLKSGHSEKVTQGYWVTGLPQDTLGYWRNDGEYAVCYKRNLITNSESELFRTKEPIEGAAWDSTGRFVVISVPTFSGEFLNLWHHVTTPFVWDTQTKEEYRLPHCGYYSNCIFWKDINKDGVR